MKIVIFGATGGIGSQAVTQALAAGHDVTAVARDPAKLDTPVRKVTADLAQPDHAVLESAVAGADAVLSGVGPRSMAESGIASRAAAAIVAAMRAAGADRLIVVSAAPIGTVPSPGNPAPPKHDPGDGFFMRHLLSPVTKYALRRPYADLAIMEDLVRQSGLAWTLVRPPRLTNKPLTGRYRTAIGTNVRRGLSVPRADVAHSMLAAITDPATVRRTIGVAT